VAAGTPGAATINGRAASSRTQHPVRPLAVVTESFTMIAGHDDHRVIHQTARAKAATTRP
jgi:hypothetical protein